MTNLTLTIKGVDRLNSIQKQLSEFQPLDESDQVFLNDFLSQIPKTNHLLLDKTSFNDEIAINVLDLTKLSDSLDKWVKLYENLPGWDYCPFCFLVDGDNPELLQNNVIIAAWFAPSYSYNCVRSSKERAYEIWLIDDGTAIFQLPTLQDAEQYPELYSFKGSWKEAYYLLIETLKKGWPMEEFPEELQQFLKKE